MGPSIIIPPDQLLESLPAWESALTDAQGFQDRFATSINNEMTSSTWLLPELQTMLAEAVGKDSKETNQYLVWR